MNRFKKMGSKIISSLLLLMVMVSLVQLPVRAAGAIITTTDFSISGTVGEEITPVEIILTIIEENSTWVGLNVGDDISSELPYYINNFPSGLSAIVVQSDKKVLKLSISGTPTQSMTGPAVLSSDVMPNPNCAFNITETVYNNVTVNGGTGTETYAEGDTVTITADAPEAGKQFKNWEVVSGGAVLADPNSATTTFTMPAVEVVLKAIYEDIPHIHTADTAWHKNDTQHWHECTAGDGEKMEVNNHTFGEWIVDTEATQTTEGSKHKDCICGQKETAVIPTSGAAQEKPVSAETDTVFKDSTTPKTGDTSETMLYYSLMVLSVCTAAFVFKRKKATGK